MLAKSGRHTPGPKEKLQTSKNHVLIFPSNNGQEATQQEAGTGDQMGA